MEKITGIQKSDGEFKKEQRGKIKQFLNLCKYDLAPSIATGSVASMLLTHVNSAQGSIDAMLFGGVAGAALILGVNGVITGVKTTKEKRDEVRQMLDEESKGKTL